MILLVDAALHSRSALGDEATMRTPYKPFPAAPKRVAIHHLDDGSEVTLLACGPSADSHACWLLSHFVDNDGHTTTLSTQEFGWHARGEAVARYEFARLMAPAGTVVSL